MALLVHCFTYFLIDFTDEHLSCCISVSAQVLFVVDRKRMSMSVDRGQKKLARQMAAYVGPAKRTLYSVDASPGLNQYVLLLSKLHFSTRYIGSEIFYNSVLHMHSAEHVTKIYYVSDWHAMCCYFLGYCYFAAVGCNILWCLYVSPFLYVVFVCL